MADEPTTPAPSTAPSSPSPSPSPSPSTSPAPAPASATASPPATPSSSPPPAAAGEPAAKLARPDYVPEGYWDETTGLKHKEFFENEHNPLVADRAARESKKLARPQKAEDFKFGLSPNFKPPAGLEFKLDEKDPAVGMYRDFALKNEFTQEQFSDGLDLVASLRVGEAHAISQAKAAEVAKLGAAGTARVDAVTTWLTAMAGEHAAAMVRVLKLAPVADTIVAFEAMIQKFQTQGAGGYQPGGRRVETASGDIPGYENMTFEQRRQAQERIRRGAAA